MTGGTTFRQWLGFAICVVVIVAAIVGVAAFVVGGWSGCACTTAPDTALSVVGGLW
jgi:hypothetical protein